MDNPSIIPSEPRWTYAPTLLTDSELTTVTDADDLCATACNNHSSLCICAAGDWQYVADRNDLLSDQSITATLDDATAPNSNIDPRLILNDLGPQAGIGYVDGHEVSPSPANFTGATANQPVNDAPWTSFNVGCEPPAIWNTVQLSSPPNFVDHVDQQVNSVGNIVLGCQDFFNSARAHQVFLSGPTPAVESLKTLAQDLRYKLVLDDEYFSAFRAVAIGLKQAGVQEPLSTLFEELKGIHLHPAFKQLVTQEFADSESSQARATTQAILLPHFLSEHSLAKILYIWGARRGTNYTLGVCNWPVPVGSAQVCHVGLYWPTGNPCPTKIVWVVKENFEELQRGTFNRWCGLDRQSAQQPAGQWSMRLPVRGSGPSRSNSTSSGGENVRVPGEPTYPPPPPHSPSSKEPLYSEVAARCLPPQLPETPQRQRQYRQPFMPGGYRCTWPNCAKAFDKQCELSKHEKTHAPTVGRPHACDTCGHRFRYPRELERHKPKHMSQSQRQKANTFLCPQADCLYHTKGFARKDHLQRHQRTVKH